MTVTLDLSTLSASTSPEDAPSRRILAAISLAVAKSKRIVVVTGAGISCSCGIPDFRSSDGLYNLVKLRYPATFVKGRDLFDASLFRSPDSTALFYTFIAELKNAVNAAEPGATHRFLRLLEGKGKLLRSYTQNIDGLEERAGSSSSQESKPKPKGKKLNTARNVQLHGDIHTPPCPACVSRSEARIMRAARPLPQGYLRPAIVLYDEPHPLGDEIGKMQAQDVARGPDMLIIMGTSLKVHGLKRLVKDFASAVHARAQAAYVGKEDGSSGSVKAKKQNPMLGKVIFVNRTPPPAEWNEVIDFHVQGETDTWVLRVEEEWRRSRPSDWEVQTKLDDTVGKVLKPALRVMTKAPQKKRVKKANGNSSDTENIPLSQASSSTSSSKTLFSSPDEKPKPKSRPAPLSPSKRANTACHYTDSSPQKRSSPNTSPSPKKTPLAERRGQANVFPERGMLFGSPTKEDEFGVGGLSLTTPPKRRLRSRAVAPVRA
ncbi:DHS-like NAD/FAD-binding domain-containing protein [Dacryopinax primogenitus]|uniref:DHS-like NAD/FAD-binding domain-containing protein n=1 Tax=Dacryopinax primogenitus (strain DJM 731) TaxID=1858805 RepID=M5FRY2_DACPD|nr:DHS-like NAD/FAD-binding domain-containing protein [Dacryopinax primogenitus]EJU00021.1 DHS-like NAD/FAD-binding domain-containing protein [Dacryopinax primogenitus]